ncbi:hypothetical protein GGU10DRAFT_381366 [Lentinula aff. detonsa]|uniref:BAH domain-containing protein n=1 Tax=Lentinula aff. detonsa TaxID=2804958 RepID=A0AA38NB31_9AGAR|nr:hypothetical protein GGU10DRAFT_381366 [Lentinula aff. detonsa]
MSSPLIPDDEVPPSVSSELEVYLEDLKREKKKARETQEAKRRVEDDIRAGNKEEKGGKPPPMPPVLRARTRKICYDIRENRSPSAKRRRVSNKRDREKSPPDPLLLREIWKDMVTNELGNVVEHYTIFKDDEGNKVRVYPGSTVFVQNEVSQQAFKRGDDNNVLLWLGTVMEIRSDVNGTLAKIRWFYSFEHARPHLARLGGMGEEWTMNYEAGVGLHELFDSDHFDVITLFYIESGLFKQKYRGFLKRAIV